MRVAEPEKKDRQGKGFWHTLKRISYYVTKVFMYAIILLLVIIGVAVAAYVIDMRVNASKGAYEPPLFGAYVIISASMEPTINVQDAVLVYRVEPSDIKLNDVITFISTDNRFFGITVTHRVVGIVKTNDGKYMFRTKGDANNAEDAALVDEDHLNGKVFLRIPMLGYLQYFLSQSYGWIIAVVVPCLGIVFYDVFKLIRLLIGNKKKKKDGTTPLVGMETASFDGTNKKKGPMKKVLFQKEKKIKGENILTHDIEKEMEERLKEHNEKKERGNQNEK